MEQEELRKETEMERKAQEVSRWKLLSANEIKLLAIGLLLCNVIGSGLTGSRAQDLFGIFRTIAEALLAFVAAESIYHTRNKEILLGRIFLAAWLTGLAFMFLKDAAAFSLEPLTENLYFGTIFILGYCTIIWDNLANGWAHRSLRKILFGLLLIVLPWWERILNYLFADIALRGLNEGYILFPEYLIAAFVMGFYNLCFTFCLDVILPNNNFLIIPLGLLFYLFREHRRIQLACLLSVALICAYFEHPTRIYMIFAALPLALYNGKRGIDLKPAFYVGVPLLVALIYLQTQRQI